MNKKFALLLVLVASLVMGASSASAAQIKAAGDWTVSADWQKGSDFDKNSEDNTFGIGQRMRTTFQFIANENLKGVLETQIGSNNWGNGLYSIGAGRTPTAAAAGTASANSAGNGNIMLRQGYVDFKVPSTQISAKVGFQGVSLPAAVGGGSAIFDDQVGAVVVSSPVTENISLLGGFARLVDKNAYGSVAGTGLGGDSAAVDLAFLAAPMNFMNKGVNVAPFFAFGYAGNKAGLQGLTGFQNSNSTGSSGTKLYWGGVATTIKLLDPFVIMADLNYGKAVYNNVAANNAQGGRSGWLFDMAVDYTGLSMMTPEIFFAYSSGENGNSSKGSGKSERMPVAGSPQNWALGSFWLQGSNSLISDSLGGTTGNNLGFWALGLSLKDIKFFDKISHTANVIYFKGTNNVDYLKQQSLTGTSAVNSATYGQFLTTKDSLWEVDLNTKYQMYDELALHLQLGYINTSFNKDAWLPVKGANLDQSDAYKVSVIMNYTF